MTTIKERILQIPEDQGIAKEKFFENLGTSYANYKGKAKSKQVGSDILVSIITNFKVSAHWLLTGEGEMYVNNAEVSEYLPTYGKRDKGVSEEQLRSELRKAEKIIKLLERENEWLRDNVPKGYEKQPRAGGDR